MQSIDFKSFSHYLFNDCVSMYKHMLSHMFLDSKNSSKCEIHTCFQISCNQGSKTSLHTVQGSIRNLRLPALGWTSLKTKTKYRKIPKISPRAYIFQRPFLRGLFWGGAYIRGGLCTEGNLRLKIDWASLILGRKFTVFLCFTLYLRAISKYNPPGGLVFGGAI